MPKDLAEIIRSLSPGALTLYKRQLVSLPADERDRAYQVLRGIPGLSDLIGRPPQEGVVAKQPPPRPSLGQIMGSKDIPLWQKGLAGVGAPFQWLQEKVVEPVAATVTSPFTPSVEDGRLGESWLEREKREYAGWQEPEFTMPWGGKFRPTKGAVEFLPWLAVPSAAGVAGKLGMVAARGGQLGRVAGMAAKVVRPLATIEQAPIKLAGKVGQKVIRRSPSIVEGAGEFTALPTSEIEKEILATNWQRTVGLKLAQYPVLRGIVERIGGKAATVTGAVEDTSVRAALIKVRVQAALESKGRTMMSSLRTIHPNPIRLFDIDRATGNARNVEPLVEGASRHINDIVEHPLSYILTTEQNRYIQEIYAIEDWVLNGLRAEGIVVDELKFDAFSHWVHRQVIGKNIDEVISDLRRGAGGRVLQKASWQKERFYETAADGVKAGLIYEPDLEKVLNLYIQTAAKQISDKRLADMIMPLGRTTEVFSLPKARQLVNAALKKQTIEAARLNALEQDMPEIASKLREALGIEDWAARYGALGAIKKELASFVPTQKEKLYLVVESLVAKRVSAQKATGAIQRALRGETIPTGTIKAIAKVLPEVKGLREATKVTLDDLIRAGEEAKRYPIELKPGSAFQEVPRLEAQLMQAREALEQEPLNKNIVRAVKKLQRKLAFAKRRIAAGEPIQLEKSPVSILVTDTRRRALTEVLDQLRGTPYEAKTATGVPVTKYTGGLIKEFRANELEAGAARSRIRQQAAQPVFGEEAVIMHPAFQGRIFPLEVAEAVRKYWEDFGYKPLTNVATAASELRTLVAAADFSVGFIQGLPFMALHPKIWGQAWKEGLKAFAKPQTYEYYLGQNISSLLERSHFRGYVGGFEYMEAMPLLQKTAGKITGLVAKRPEAGQAAIRQTYGRFEAFFGAYGDVARNELWLALKGRAKNTQELLELARHIDRLTGVMSTKGLGIGKTQRDFEQAFLFFAPRYTRAGFALVGDAFRGGMTGAETKKALASMMAAGVGLYWGTAKALGQEPNFDPTTSRFMTIEITDPLTGTTRHVGIGGMMTSLVRFGADVVASTIGMGQNEPLDFVKISRKDNPFIRFMYSKTSPVTSSMMELVTGQNYFGEPFETPQDYALFLAEQVMPIAIQSAVVEEKGFAPTAIGTEILGLRAFPRSEWETRDVIRDRLAREKYQMSWDELGRQRGELAQVQLVRSSPELQKAMELAEERSNKLATGEGKDWLEWKQDSKVIEETYQKAATNAVARFQATRDGVTFRLQVKEAKSNKRAMYSALRTNPQYSRIYAFFDEPLERTELAKMNQKDIARKEYYGLLYSPDMTDEFGQYKFDEAKRREDLFVKKYGRATLDYIDEFQGAKWDEPSELKALRDATEMLEPYQQIEDKVWALYPPEMRVLSDQIKLLERTDPDRARRFLKQYPAILRAREIIAQQRKQMREANPMIEQAYRTFYG